MDLWDTPFSLLLLPKRNKTRNLSHIDSLPLGIHLTLGVPGI